ncbi:MAG: DUF58 domain-containing protein [Chloroflexi bacterium]|nr:DUF58 domain-containing protein [Chloroflexota bacterium]
MIPTPRLLALALATAAPLALGEWLPGLEWGTPILLGLVGAVLALDARLTPRPDRFGVRRELADRLSLGAENGVEIVVRNLGSRLARLRVRDELPSAFDGSGGFDGKGGSPRASILEGMARPGGVARLGYTVTPPLRGDFRFGRVVLRYRSALGLFWRQHAYPCEASVKVYPNLRDLSRYDLLVRRGLLVDAGTRAARRFGSGTEFERLREYVPDDEFRRINWKATARRGVPISAEFETERSQNVVVVLDAGRLMAQVADGLTKLDHALNAGLMLAYAAGLRGDRVALLAYADRVVTFLPPRRGRRAFLQILDQLYRLEPRSTESDHARAFSYLAGRSLRRSLLVLFTDVADPEPSRALLAHLARAAEHHLVALVTVADPALLGPANREPRDSQQLYEKAVAQRLLDERRQILDQLAHRGVITLDHPADRLSARVVATYLELKARGRL